MKTLSKIPIKEWPGKLVEVYGNTQRCKPGQIDYLYDAVVMPKKDPGYSDKKGRVRVQVTSGSTWASKFIKAVLAENCRVKEAQDG